MRARLPSIVAAMALLVATPVAAQAPTEAKPSINLTAEQHHIIKEIVLKDMAVKPVSGDVRVSIGQPVAGNIDLQSFPPSVTEKVPEVKSHNFFVKDDQVVIVSLKDHTVADVIK